VVSMRTFIKNASELLLDLASACARSAQKALQQTKRFVDQLKQQRG